MKIVKIMGGLGNQMFQYSLYKSLKIMGQNTKLDTSWYLDHTIHNDYELEKIFGLTPDYASNKQCNKFADLDSSIYGILKRKFFPKKTHYFEKILFELDETVLKSKMGYFEGYWQTENYFKNIRSELLNDFSFKNIDKYNLDFSRRLKEINSIGVHVRRGDYVSNPKASKVHGGICNLDYYIKSIDLMVQKVDNPKFVVFSDDVSWCKDHLKLDDPIYVDWNTGKNSFKDMYLMSMCKHNVIANSSFSWWGAWLNQDMGKIIIAPKKWINTCDSKEICPKDWLRC